MNNATIKIENGNLTECNAIAMCLKPNGARYVIVNAKTGIIESGKTNRSISFSLINANGENTQPLDGVYTVNLENAKTRNRTTTTTATARSRSTTYTTATATASLTEILKQGFDNLTTANCSTAIVYCDRIIATLNKEKENEKTLILKVQKIRNNLLDKKAEIEKQAEIERNNEIEKASEMLDAFLA